MTIEDVVTADGVDAMRISFPMLVFDGKNETTVELKDNAVRLTLDEKSVHFAVTEPAELKLQRSGKRLPHRNGMVEATTAETTEKRMIYRITAGRD